MAYRIYITDSLQLIPQQKYLTQRWGELFNKQTDTRSADEIAADVIAKCQLEIAEENA